ncbi:hypothetical protein DID76_04025 [Candidatus Marinamargulisbacteria bacterium SCGC AG-414-C22]|nr:hypothetical protein DID76_04025 [Candidatus Marinamargulisbacteria bacterium SCGC AG-414-C22]
MDLISDHIILAKDHYFVRKHVFKQVGITLLGFIALTLSFLHAELTWLAILECFFHGFIPILFASVYYPVLLIRCLYHLCHMKHFGNSRPIAKQYGPFNLIKLFVTVRCGLCLGILFQCCFLGFGLLMMYLWLCLHYFSLMSSLIYMSTGFFVFCYTAILLPLDYFTVIKQLKARINDN